MINIYLGDTGNYLEKIAKLADPLAVSITVNNFNTLTTGTYYTSLKDLSSTQILATVLRKANKIIYCPPIEKWSDNRSGQSRLQTLTEEHLKIFRWLKPVENFNAVSDPETKEAMLALSDLRKTDDPQLWIAGGSTALGAGVELNQRYGQLIADEINRQVSFISTRSSSILWIADQVLRSDIREGDIVVVELTPLSRVPFFHNKKLTHVTPMNYISNPELKHILDINVLDGENIVYQSVTSIFQIVNFCSKVKATLLLAVAGGNEILDYLEDIPGLILFSGLWGFDITDGQCVNFSYPDLGSDNYHPGIKTHRYFAEEILRKIKTYES